MILDTRNPRIDQVKGLAILAVVFIHASDVFGCDGILFDVMMSFARLAVPIFLFYFAYFLEKKFDVGCPYIILRKRFLSLLVPYLIWSLFYYVILWRNTDVGFIKGITKYWLGYGWSGQYYFIILFQLIAFYPVLRRLALTAYSKWILSSIVLSLYVIIAYSLVPFPGGISKLSDRLFVYWFPYLVLAVLVCRKNIKTQWLGAFLALIIIPTEYILVRSNTSAYLKPSLLLALFFFAGWLVRQGELLPKSRITAGVESLGRNSLAIFVMNPALVLVAKLWVGFSTWVPSQSVRLLSTVLLTVVISVVSSAIGIGLRKSRLGGLVGA